MSRVAGLVGDCAGIISGVAALACLLQLGTSLDIFPF